MSTGARGAVEQAKEIWQKLTPRRRFFVAAAAAVAVLGIAALSLYSPTEQYEVLFSSLSPEDAGTVVEKLKEEKIPYQLERGGATILVPEARVYEQRLSLAQAGIPKGGGVGFEVFDQQSIATTSFVEKTNYQRALQGELARTIGAIDSIESARVHLAMGARSFFQQEDEKPTASITVNLRPGRTLSKGQVSGIVHLVASSVDGLSPERVTVVDERGTLLSDQDQDSAQVEKQRALEHLLSERVEQMLARVVGVNHVAVEVTAEIDYSQTDRTENAYDQDKSAIRSEAVTAQGVDPTQEIGGLAGARGNLPGAPAPAPAPAPAGNPGGQRQETRNYEVSHVVTHTTSAPSVLRRLHVAVLVDAGTPPPGTDKWTPEQLAEIEALTKVAAGIDTARGDQLAVRSVAFAPVAPLDAGSSSADPNALPFNTQWFAIAGGGLVGLMFLVWLLRRKKNAKPPIQLLPAKVSEIEATLPSSEEPALLPGDTGPSARERAQEAARIDAARAARVLSAWLAEDTKNSQRA